MLSKIISFSFIMGLNLSLAAPVFSLEKPKDPKPTANSPETAPATKRVVGPLSESEAAALATMNDRIKEYIDLHMKIEKSLPPLPKEATPQQIDENQRKFEKLMRDARGGAKQGDLFTPQAQPIIKKLLANVFSEPDGKQLKQAIFDENPGPMTLSVNMRYPDSVPLSNVPPQVLQTLPKLTEDMEYRFIGNQLIIFDSHAHIIADFIKDSFVK